MNIQFTSEAERKRLEKRTLKPTWELYSGQSIVEAARTARDLGWKHKKVQVRFEKDRNNTITYYVEPYEKGCGCKGLLKYKDFFD